MLAAAAQAHVLGLADLLSLAFDELPGTPGSGWGRGRTSPTAQYDGSCLAA